VEPAAVPVLNKCCIVELDAVPVLNKYCIVELAALVIAPRPRRGSVSCQALDAG
jgi:hypothetical protein